MMETAERITETYLSFFPAWLYVLLMVFITAIMVCITIYACHECARASTAEKKLDTLRRMESSDTYDIRSVTPVSGDDRKTLEKLVRHKIPSMLCETAGLSVMILAFLCTACLAETFITAYAHGYTEGLNVNAGSLWNGIRLSPETETLPETLDGSLVICYRFGCQDCEAVYPELSEALTGIPGTVWIATRTEQGKEFAEKYRISTVPSAVYFPEDGGAPLSWILWEKDPVTHETSVNHEALKELIKVAGQNRSG